jgi:chemotaxis protein MotB
MGREKQSEADEPAGAPEWMVTFSDCMTLLLTFFVLFLSFSSFDNKAFHKLKIIFSNALPSVSPIPIKPKDAFLSTRQIQKSIKEIDKGSEKPTLATGAEDGLKEETEAVDFRSRKIFLIPSKKIFWGKGTAISSQGRDFLAATASFLKEAPNRVVISENRPADDRDSKQLGLLRAWAVIKYLTTKQGISKGRFSVSAASTVNQESLKGAETGHINKKAQRQLEIVLLERSICN